MGKVINLFFNPRSVLSSLESEPSAREKSFSYSEGMASGETTAYDSKMAKFQESSKKVLIMRMINEASNDVNRIASSTGQRYFNLTEDYMAENQVAIIEANIDRAKDLASDVYTGAQYGMIFGPIGMIAGAVAGGVKYGIDTAVEIRNKSSQWYSALNATNAQTDFMQSRMGYIDGGRGTEN